MNPEVSRRAAWAVQFAQPENYSVFLDDVMIADSFDALSAPVKDFILKVEAEYGVRENNLGFHMGSNTSI